jgi:predicted nucleic acid-binding protein
MRLFLDSSALLAAAGSAQGASRFVVTEAASRNWELISSDYCAEETRRNLPKLRPAAAKVWQEQLARRVRFVRTTVALDKPLVFPKAKDRPVVITALAARADWLLTLDEGDFQTKLGREIYGLRLASPGEFLLSQRVLGVL